MTADPEAFAEAVRRLRTARGMTLRALAGAAHYGKSYVHDIETGKHGRVPGLDVVRRLDDALEADGRLIALARPEADAAAEAQILCDPIPSPPTEQPMVADDVEQLRSTVRHLVALDTAHGAESLYATAVRAFRNAHRRLATAGAQSAVHSDAEAAIAEVGEVAAWLAYDSERQDLSRQVAHEALLIARRAGDADMERFLLSQLSMQATYLGRGAEALEFADQVIAARPRSKRVVAMTRVRRARALALLGDATRALDELRRAREGLAAGIGSNDPAWTWWLHCAELAGHEARIRAAAGDGHGAVRASEESVLELPATQGRDQALFRAWLAFDLVEVGAWREVGEVAEQLIERTPVAGSARVPRLLRRAERRAGRAGAPSWLVDAIREAADVSAPIS